MVAASNTAMIARQKANIIHFFIDSTVNVPPD